MAGVTGGPVPLSVPLPAYGDGTVAANWDGWFLDELVAPLTEAVTFQVPVSGRVLWGNVASGINAAAAQLAVRRPDLAPGAWQAASRLFSSPLLRAERHQPGPAFRRSSCCLYYRLAQGAPGAPGAPGPAGAPGPPGASAPICGDCVLTARARQGSGR